MRYCLILLLVLLCFAGLAIAVPDDAEAHKSSWRGHNGCNGFLKLTCYGYGWFERVWVTNDGGMWVTKHWHKYDHRNALTFAWLHLKYVRAKVCAKAHPC